MGLRNYFGNFYFLLFLIWIVIGGFILVILPKEELHLSINSYNSAFADSFFYYFTDIGDGLFATIITLVVLVFSRKKALQLGAVLISTSLITQALKKLVFTDSPRPFKYFNSGKGLHLIDGLKMHSDFSFPSGHSTTAFALFFCLSLFTNNKLLQLLFFTFALLAAFSRVYLSQHFFGDIYAGSLIGISFGFLVFIWLEKAISSKYDSPFNFIRLK